MVSTTVSVSVRTTIYLSAENTGNIKINKTIKLKIFTYFSPNSFSSTNKPGVNVDVIKNFKITVVGSHPDHLVLDTLCELYFHPVSIFL